MIKEKIYSYFERFNHLRILFFFDENEEYKADVEALDLEDIHIEWYANNPFSLKCKLIDELKNTNVLLYLPMAAPRTQEAYHTFPLMGLLLANKELQLDNVGNFMEDYGLQRHQKSLVQKYMAELQYGGIQKVCAPVLNAANFVEPNVQQAIVSALLKFKNIESWSVLCAKLMVLASHSETTDLDKLITRFQKNNLHELVVNKLNQITGVSIKTLSKEGLLEITRAILYNQLTQTIEVTVPTDPYAALKIKEGQQITRLNQLLQDVDKNSTVSTAFKQALKNAGKKIKGATLIEAYGNDATFAECNTEMIWAIVNSVQSLIQISPQEVIERMEQISLQSDLDELIKETLKYVVQVAKVHRSINSIKSYILDTPEIYIHTYVQEHYKIDAAYRRAVLAFKSLDISEIPNMINLENIQQELNKSYDKHVDELNREWLRCLNQFNFDYSKVNVPKQYNFYKTELATEDKKVVVIISDALRYEAASELLSEMHGDAKNTAEMRYMLASIPSKTNVGMAQLLPGVKSYNNGEIKSDNFSTSGTENRSAILNQHKPEATAIQYSELDRFNQAQKRELFKKPLVYVYHDIIDARGDKKVSERSTFKGVEEAIAEIKRLVKNLHASNNVSKVIITADHGFLYNDIEIEDKDKENITADNVITSGNRYFITEEEQSLDLGYSISLSATTAFNENAFVNIPLSVNRYKKQGVGQQFAHGGGSLQELIVPLIESSRQRKEVSKKVVPMLINRGGLKVVSNILKLNILQETEVSRLEKERTLQIGLYRGSNLVSNLETITLNFTSEAPSERMLRVELTLSSEAGTESFLKLKAFDVDDSLNPVIEETVQNNTLIQTDF
ncbi:BREX-1 system phosphatase PglZ type A [Marinifilum sp. RC60d5]|uniref:BREX-1 system phosphatase PglZ type A n=1 Tax=Marinifilum sp. RC60d5 TaxID=3458414 RepID=UPI004035D4A1